MHFLLLYHLAPDYLERRVEFREEHLRLAWAASDRGEFVLGGALDSPSDMALLLFQGDGPEAATAFAETDPYVLNGLVSHWEVRKWNTVAGEMAADPIRP